MSTGKQPQFPNQAGAQSQANDPFFSLERILQSDNATKAQAAAPNPYGLPPRSTATHDALSGLRPSHPASPPSKTEPNWGDLEAEIASFTTAQQRVTEEHFKRQPEIRAEDQVAFKDQVVFQETAYPPVAPSEPRTKFEDLSLAERSRSGVKTIGAIVGIALVGAVGIFGYRMVSGGSSSSEPKVIKASTTAPKVTATPAEPPKSVIDRAPNTTAERVVPRDEKPLSPAEQNLQNSNARVVQQAPADDLEPRKVRTVSITPDGATRSQLPTAIAPLPIQTSPAVEAAPPRTVRAQPITLAPKPVEAAPKPVEAAPIRQITTAAAPKPVAPKPTVTATATPATPKTKAPLALGPNAVNEDVAPVQVASSSKVTSGSGTHVVQVGSADSEAAAKARFKSLQDKHASLKGRSASFVEAEVNGNTVYRIRLAPTSKDGATEFCSSLKSSGGSCFVAAK